MKKNNIERKLKPIHFTPSRTITSTVGYIREYKDLPITIFVYQEFDCKITNY